MQLSSEVPPSKKYQTIKRYTNRLHKIRLRCPNFNNLKYYVLLSSSLSPLCRVSTHIFLRQTMSLGNTLLQLFCLVVYGASISCSCIIIIIIIIYLILPGTPKGMVSSNSTNKLQLLYY